MIRRPAQIGSRGVISEASPPAPILHPDNPEVPGRSAPAAGAWLAAVRGTLGSRTCHSIDAERVPFDLAEATARIGEGASILQQAAREAASERQRAAFDELPWGAVYRLAAKEIFRTSATEPVTYADLSRRMRAYGLDVELGLLLESLPRPLLTKLQ